MAPNTTFDATSFEATSTDANLAARVNVDVAPAAARPQYPAIRPAVERDPLTGWLDHRELLVHPQGNTSRLYAFAKRALDIVGAVGLLVALGPVMLATLVVLLVTTKGRPIFVQERVGRCGRRFRMLKFRTMHLDADRRQHLVQNEQAGPVFKNRRDPRITSVGRILRSTSIDETPQLFNVLLGHMALVGPRPPVAREVAQYEPWQRRRLAVKPGLTCLWQVSGRNEIGFEDWVRMDLWYLERQNLLVDLWLLARTPISVVTCRGAY